MGSWILVITWSGPHLSSSPPPRHHFLTMRLRWTTLLSPLLALAGSSSSYSQTSWSNLGLLSSQASKRSVEDSHESFLADDMVTSASDNLPETDNSYDLADFKSPESRGEPHRRRKKYRTRRRKTRYEPPLVVPDNKLADNVLYERDSGYSPPSSSYEAPSYNSYEPPSYDSPSYSPPSYEAYGGRGGYSYRGFGSQPSSNSISKSDTLAANSNIYDYDYYDEDYENQEKEENFLLKALKYLRGDFSVPRNDDYSDYYYDDGYNKRRRRDTDGELEKEVNSVETVFPFLEEITQLGGIKRLNEIECQKKLFCEIAGRGLREEGNFVQNTLGSVVSHTPTFLANMAGLTDLFQVAKAGDCAEFQCTSY